MEPLSVIIIKPSFALKIALGREKKECCGCASISDSIPTTLCHELSNFQTISGFFFLHILHEIWILSSEKRGVTKELTAFTVGLLRFYEFNLLPFRPSNAPTTYYRIMEECLGDPHPKACPIYRDDLIYRARRRNVPDGNHHCIMFRLFNNFNINENYIL